MIAVKRRTFLLMTAAAVFEQGTPPTRPGEVTLPSLRGLAGRQSDIIYNSVQDGEWLANFSLERDGRVMESKMGSVRQRGGHLVIQSPEGSLDAQNGDVIIVTYPGMNLS